MFIRSLRIAVVAVVSMLGSPVGVVTAVGLVGLGSVLVLLRGWRARGYVNAPFEL